MATQRIICIYTLYSHSWVVQTVSKINWNIYHVNRSPPPPTLPCIRLAMNSVFLTASNFGPKPSERRRQREKNKICKMKINRKKSVRRRSKLTRTEDYNNLQRSKRHSAPINTGTGAAPPRHQIQLRLFMMGHTLPFGNPYAATAHAATFFSTALLWWPRPRPRPFARLLISTNIFQTMKNILVYILEPGARARAATIAGRFFRRSMRPPRILCAECDKLKWNIKNNNKHCWLLPTYTAVGDDSERAREA